MQYLCREIYRSDIPLVAEKMHALHFDIMHECMKYAWIEMVMILLQRMNVMEASGALFHNMPILC